MNLVKTTNAFALDNAAAFTMPSPPSTAISTAAHSSGFEVLAGNNQSAFQHLSSPEDRAIIIVGGREPSPYSTDSVNNSSIIIVGGRNARLAFDDQLNDRAIIIVGGKDPLDATKAAFDSMSKGLESQDKLGNFEIQDLMSQYNQSESLSSSVARKKHDADNSIIGKI